MPPFEAARAIRPLKALGVALPARRVHEPQLVAVGVIERQARPMPSAWACLSVIKPTTRPCSSMMGPAVAGFTLASSW